MMDTTRRTLAEWDEALKRLQEQNRQQAAAAAAAAASVAELPSVSTINEHRAAQYWVTYAGHFPDAVPVGVRLTAGERDALRQTIAVLDSASIIGFLTRLVEAAEASEP